MATFRVRPIAPSRMVPSTPRMAKAGDAGAAVPTPDGCQPVAKRWKTDDQPGSVANWPTAGIPVVNSPLEPIRTTMKATTQAVRMPCPDILPRSVGPTGGVGARRPRASARAPPGRSFSWTS